MDRTKAIVSIVCITPIGNNVSKMRNGQKLYINVWTSDMNIYIDFNFLPKNVSGEISRIEAFTTNYGMAENAQLT